jgi:PIN domain nuclease of toxin-antitoxin system
MISYLDTSIGVWLAEKNRRRITKPALEQMSISALRISPVVLLEFQYLFEIKRTALNSRDIQRKLEYELGVIVCPLSFEVVAAAALDEDWTRDPFDRLIVAHAKANGFAPLITSDEKIRLNYPRAIW